ncbi:hypothetical protein DCS_04452 [Drechmeria coniospora]|uniref:Uncharacterized protein n=1 Tax=Drechmeria coniospora TaxID=98403 RepID=A0A151GJZ7_DRECN|nr:hypothetical protein DCS_04452 [Drechmeria coniospora]KYK57443.1 hypothetical protein DCS_04452 [Drechmeria coniospora]
MPAEMRLSQADKRESRTDKQADGRPRNADALPRPRDTAMAVNLTPTKRRISAYESRTRTGRAGAGLLEQDGGRGRGRRRWQVESWSERGGGREENERLNT